MVELGELVARAVEAAWQAVALKSGVSSLVGALECVFTGDVAGASTDPAPFVLGWFGAILGVVVEQEASVTLLVWLGDGGGADGDRCAEHGKSTGAVDLLYLPSCGINKDE